MLNKKLLIILVLVVVIVLIAVGVLIFLDKKQVDNNINNTSNMGENNTGQTLPQSGGGEKVSQPAENINPSQPVIDPKEQAKTDAMNVAKFFVEMIGSYSPDSRFQNIIDVQPMMTKSMKNWSEDFIKRNLANSINSQESITTKVLKTEILFFDVEKTNLLLVTRREKIVGGVETNYSQDAEVELTNDGTAWKINNLVWK